MTTEPEPGTIIPQLILIAILTLINAFFASAEMAIVSVNKNKVKKLADEGNKKAKLLYKLIEEPSNFLATIQIGITLAGLFSSASAATGISGKLAILLKTYNISYASEISIIIITLLLSFVTLVFGELVPKRIALKKAEKISFLSVRVIYFISVIAKPIIKVLSLSTSLVLMILGFKNEDDSEIVSEEEIRELVSEGQAGGAIEENEKDMINSIFEFNDKMSKEIMTSRKDTYVLNINDNSEEYLDNILSLQYSRIPVYEKNIDNIIGILYIKDFMIEARKFGFENVDLRKILHKPYFVPETKKTDELFRELKNNKNHMAILIDEYGGFSGIVTMEDLIEEIMGDIEDEYDIDDPDITKINEKEYIIKGTLSINEFNDEFNANIVEGDYDTINGLIITKLGEIPKDDEDRELDISGIKFKIKKIKERRVELIKVTLE